MPIIKITDIKRKELDIFARYTEAQLLNKEYPEKGLFIAESPNVCIRALNAGFEPVALLIEEKHIEGEAKEVIEKCGDIPVFTAKFDVLTQITGFKLTRGVLCAMKRKPLLSLSEIIKNKKRIAVLEEVTNPTNVGAIFRSAAALDMDAVILSDDCSDPFYRRAARVSMGTCFQIPWTYVPGNITKALKEAGFTTAALALSDNSIGIDDERLKTADKLALLLGSEGYGLKAETIEDCDYTVKIPMKEGIDSLNVAAASAVAFWEINKK